MVTPRVKINHQSVSRGKRRAQRFSFPSLFSDTTPKVIQPAARRANGSSPQPTVNNFAATNNLRPDIDGSGRIALGGSRSFVLRLTKAKRSSPARTGATVKMSERTTAFEAPCITMASDSAAVRAPKGKIVKPWMETTHFAGFDWARDHHDVVIVNRRGQLVAELRFQHSLEGWQQFKSQVKDYPA